MWGAKLEVYVVGQAGKIDRSACVVCSEKRMGKERRKNRKD